MQTSFLSRIVNRELYRLLHANPALTDVVGGRIFRGYQYPESVELPACLFYMEQSVWDAGGHTELAEHLTAGEYRYVVRIDGQGDSDMEIAPAAQAQLDALAGQIIDTDDGYQVTFTAAGETPITSTYQGATQYQRLGTVYRVYVTKG